jgi:nonsense-mediated mRNA decay protein 3|tara:strand:- start:2616 stop:3524 length:909 start_codon:yes stop_codon:yes gene_type:complete
MHEVEKRWVRIEDEELGELRLRENLGVTEGATAVTVDMAYQPIDDRTARLHVTVDGELEGYKFEDQHEVLLQTSNAVCPSCTRKAGAYFEATMQLRSAGRRLSEEELKDLRGTLDELLDELESDPMFFVTKEGPVTGGWDLQLGSKALARTWARRLVRRFGGTTKETSTLVGMREGSEVTRLTLSYRKPAYGLGDVIRLKREYWLVSAWQKDGPKIRRLDRNERTGVTWRDMEKATVVSKSDDQFIVDILNRDSSGAEVMDPNDYRVVTVALPYDNDSSLPNLRIAFIDDSWLALPGHRGEE